MFLGRLEEMAGRPELGISADGPLGWSGVLERLSPQLAGAVAADRVRVAINGALIADKEGLTLSDGDELAFLPPVSGG